MDFLGKKGWIAALSQALIVGGQLPPCSIFCSFIIYPPKLRDTFWEQRHRLLSYYATFCSQNPICEFVFLELRVMLAILTFKNNIPNSLPSLIIHADPPLPRTGGGEVRRFFLVGGSKPS